MILVIDMSAAMISHVTTKQVLFIEDDRGYQDLMRAAFELGNIPYSLHVVNNGQKALDFLYQRGKYENTPHPDLIILDLYMPKIDGKDLLRIIKSDNELKLIPVIVFTNSTSKIDIIDSYNLQANSCVSKPSDLDEFLEIIRKSVDFWLNCAISPWFH